MLHFHILSLFSEYFESAFRVSILKRAQEAGLIKISYTDLRDFGEGKHKKVDDRPYGGGPGMVMKPRPLSQAIRSVKQPHSKVIYLSPQGQLLNAKKCEELAKERHLLLLCGHYEGVDERIIDKEVDEEISIGDYILTSGCPAAVVLIDSVSRFVPGVLGGEASASLDSFQQEGIFEGPQYTRPVIFEGKEVPEILRGGNHAQIGKWRKEQGLKKTSRVRPDLVDIG